MVRFLNITYGASAQFEGILGRKKDNKKRTPK